MKSRLLLLSLVLAGGCMPFHWYPLPVGPGEARSTFAPIATAASNAGYRFYQHDDRVIVEPDAHTRIDYTFDVSGNYAMCVMLKDDPGPAGRDAAFAAAKARGDEVWNRAMALRVAPVVPVAAVPPPAPTFQINVSR